MKRTLTAVLLTTIGCTASLERDAELAPSEEVSSTEQELSADPGPKTIFYAGSKARPSRLDGASSDGTYVYAHFYSNQDEYCWGSVLRIPVGGGTVESIAAPCFTGAFAIGNGGAYFTVVRSQGSVSEQESRGIYHVTFGLNERTMLTSVEPLGAIAADGSHVYWSDGAALHRMLPDGSGDEILSADAGGFALLLDDTSAYGFDAAGLWKTPKTGGAKVTLTTAATGNGSLVLDRDELFWHNGMRGQIWRLSVMGGTPSLFYEAQQYPPHVVVPTGIGVSGLAVAGRWVYWSESAGLKRRAKAGGAVETVVTDEPSARVLAADATNVYHSRLPLLDPPFQELRRMPIADIVAPFCRDRPRRVVDSASTLGLAAAGSWLYYTEADTVRRVWKNGGTVETVAINQPGPRALHASINRRAWVTDDGVNAMGVPFAPPYVYPGGYPADATDVVIDPSYSGVSQGFPVAVIYYTDGARVVGFRDTTLATGVAPYRLAIDEGWLYFTDRGDQTLNRVPLAGGSVEVLARLSKGEIGDLDLDSDDVFFGVDRGSAGSILRVPKAGGAVALVAKGAFSPFDLEASNAFYVYFTSQGPSPMTVYRVAKHGGRAVARVSGGAAWELDTLGRCVFYATGAGIDVVSRL